MRQPIFLDDGAKEGVLLFQRQILALQFTAVKPLHDGIILVFVELAAQRTDGIEQLADL